MDSLSVDDILVLENVHTARSFFLVTAITIIEFPTNSLLLDGV